MGHKTGAAAFYTCYCNNREMPKPEKRRLIQNPKPMVLSSL